MSWLDKIAKKRLEELEAHPELNSDKFAEKMSTLYFAIVLLIVAILILLFWYDTEHFERKIKNSHNSGYNNINPIPTITPVINRMEMVLKMSFFLAS